MSLEFKKYISRFITGFGVTYKDNEVDTDMIHSIKPIHQTIDAIQLKGSESIQDVEQLINSKSVCLRNISRCEGNPLICYPFYCLFESSNFNPGYQLKINPDDYLIWDDKCHKFFAISENTFSLLYE